MKKRGAEMQRYSELFAAAFDELHQAVVQHVKNPRQYVGPHHDYPEMSSSDGGFPTFHETGFYKDGSPRDYVGTLRPRGLAGLLGGYRRPEKGFPNGAALASFLRTHEIGKRLSLRPLGDKDLAFSDWPVDHLVGDAVERYLHVYGLDAPIEAKRRTDILRPLVFGTVFRTLDLRLVVPVAMTHFEASHFQLTETTYLARLPRKLQLARARMSTHGSGAVKNVVGAATHAFVSTGWTLEVDDVEAAKKSLRSYSANTLDAIDSFFGALRIATGISTGYAQILWVPKGWALDYFCDLTPVYGTTLRQYPSAYDDYGWVRSGSRVTAKQLEEVRRIYGAVVKSNSEAVRLALKRLNACLTRTDAPDAILDGTIGLELLLGDDQNQSLAFKLRLRAAALALVKADPSLPASDVASKVKRLYEVRSAIVHGKRKKRSKKASEPSNADNATDRFLASDLLRFVLDVLLTHPEYQNPAKIDEGLLLRGDEVAVSYEASNQRQGNLRRATLR